MHRKPNATRPNAKIEPTPIRWLVAPSSAAMVRFTSESSPCSAATFEIYKDKGGKFRFRFMDSEGTELAMSPRGYAEKADIQKAIDTIKREAARAKVEEEK